MSLSSTLYVFSEKCAFVVVAFGGFGLLHVAVEDVVERVLCIAVVAVAEGDRVVVECVGDVVSLDAHGVAGSGHDESGWELFRNPLNAVHKLEFGFGAALGEKVL